LRCFVQEQREKRYDVAWKQVAERVYEAIDPQKGEAEAEDVERLHKRYWQ